jgi:prophage maintenance system killer protein
MKKSIFVYIFYLKFNGLTFNIQVEAAIDLLTGKIFHFDFSIDRHIKTVTQENS